MAGLRELAFLDKQGILPDAARRHDIRPLVATQAIAVRHALRVEDAADFMRLMTVDAGRDHVRLLLPQLAANHFAVDNFDQRVTLLASLRDVALRYR